MSTSSSSISSGTSKMKSLCVDFGLSAAAFGSTVCLLELLIYIDLATSSQCYAYAASLLFLVQIALGAYYLFISKGSSQTSVRLLLASSLLLLGCLIRLAQIDHQARSISNLQDNARRLHYWHNGNGNSENQDHSNCHWRNWDHSNSNGDPASRIPESQGQWGGHWNHHNWDASNPGQGRHHEGHHHSQDSDEAGSQHHRHHHPWWNQTNQNQAQNNYGENKDAEGNGGTAEQGDEEVYQEKDQGGEETDVVDEDSIESETDQGQQGGDEAEESGNGGIYEGKDQGGQEAEVIDEDSMESENYQGKEEEDVVKSEDEDEDQEVVVSQTIIDTEDSEEDVVVEFLQVPVISTSTSKVEKYSKTIQYKIAQSQNIFQQQTGEFYPQAITGAIILQLAIIAITALLRCRKGRPEESQQTHVEASEEITNDQVSENLSAEVCEAQAQAFL